MNSKDNYSKEPWKYYWGKNEHNEADCGIYFELNEGGAYAICRAPKYATEDEWKNNARRIVACVNACTGASTEFLEKSASISFPIVVLENTIEERDQLKAINAELVEALKQIISDGDYINPEGMKRIAREALAKQSERHNDDL